MENIKKNKIIYIIICCIIILVCVIICFFMDNTNNINDYSYLNLTEEVNTENVEKSLNEVKDDIYIHISGEVVNPGVVIVSQGDRILDVIEKAGGVTNFADIEKVNLAYQVSDGQKINIPNINNEDDEVYVMENSGENIIDSKSDFNEKKRININTATQTELESLTGIGPSIASKIIKHRSENGKFKSIEEIKKISGIGESKYKNIQDEICVK